MINILILNDVPKSTFAGDALLPKFDVDTTYQ